MKRRVAPTLIAMILLGALAAQAQARRQSPSLSVASAKAAISGFARQITHEIPGAGSAAPMSWEVSACGRRRAVVICTGEWVLAGEKCSVRMEALPPRPAIRVKELGKLECSRQNSGELNRTP